MVEPRRFYATVTQTYWQRKASCLSKGANSGTDLGMEVEERGYINGWDMSLKKQHFSISDCFGQRWKNATLDEVCNEMKRRGWVLQNRQEWEEKTTPIECEYIVITKVTFFIQYAANAQVNF